MHASNGNETLSASHKRAVVARNHLTEGATMPPATCLPRSADTVPAAKQFLQTVDTKADALYDDLRPACEPTKSSSSNTQADTGFSTRIID